MKYKPLKCKTLHFREDVMNYRDFKTVDPAWTPLTVDSIPFLTKPPQVDYRALRSLPALSSTKKVLDAVGTVPTKLKVHQSGAGLPFILPHREDGTLATFARVRLHDDYQGILYDHLYVPEQRRRTSLADIVVEEPLSGLVPIPKSPFILDLPGGLEHVEGGTFNTTFRRQYRDRGNRASVTFSITQRYFPLTGQLAEVSFSYWIQREESAPLKPDHRAGAFQLLFLMGEAISFQGQAYFVDHESLERKGKGAEVESDGEMCIFSETGRVVRKVALSTALGNLIPYSFRPEQHNTFCSLADLLYAH